MPCIHAHLYSYSFLSLALDESIRPISCPGHSTPGKEPQYQLNRRGVGPRASYKIQDNCELFYLTKIQKMLYEQLQSLSSFQHTQVYLSEFSLPP